MNEATNLPARPERVGWGDVSSLLVDFAITTWDVDPAALARTLPSGLTPEVVSLDAGRPRALVSAVTFLNTDFFVRFAPFVRLRAHQTNYRAYVRRGATRCAWFFGTSLASFGVVVPRVLWGLPWARSTVTHEAAWGPDGLQRYRWDAKSEHGDEQLSLRGTGRALGRLPGFDDAAHAHEVLTQPMLGYLRRRKTTVVRYSVWHEPLAVEVAEVDRARFSLWTTLGLVEPDQPPHSVLVQRQTQYRIHLPPRRATDLPSGAPRAPTRT